MTVSTFASWIQEVKSSPNDAHCRICRTNFNLSNMVRKAVSSHMAGAKHIKNYQHHTQNSSQGTLAPCLKTGKNASIPVELFQAQDIPVFVCEQKDVESHAVESKASSATDIRSTVSEARDNVNAMFTMQTFVTNDKVTKTEVLWAMKCVMSNSFKDMKGIFALMFPDSAIASKLTIGSTKLAYVVTHGLAPYFHNSLTKTLNSCSEYVVCFDEALNNIAQGGQMDIVIRYWDKQTNCVSSRYFNSAFMGHATAEDILETFQAAIGELAIGKLVQVSMDGPAVNWKFLEAIDTHLSKDAKARVLLELGSCGLHVLHGSLQSDHKASSWDVNVSLRALCSLFKDEQDVLIIRS